MFDLTGESKRRWLLGHGDGIQKRAVNFFRLGLDDAMKA